MLVDADQPLAEQDLRIISMVVESGRSLVIAYNKWDLLDEERRHYLEREIDRQLHNARWAPRVNISAKTVGTWRSWCRASRPRWRAGAPASRRPS